VCKITPKFCEEVNVGGATNVKRALEATYSNKSLTSPWIIHASSLEVKAQLIKLQLILI